MGRDTGTEQWSGRTLGQGGLVRDGEEGVAMVDGLRRQEDAACTQDISTDWASLPWSGGPGAAAVKGKRRKKVSHPEAQGQQALSGIAQ